MKTLITAAFSAAIGQAGSIPSEIIYLPEGEHEISATVDGQPKTITVRLPRERGHEVAAKLQAALEKRQGENVRPHFGFDHKAGAASALPQSFRYEPGKGVLVSVEWTSSGRAGIEGKDWSYLSPTFLLGEDGVPDGLPEKGECASLVNSPAFRNIQRIAASDAGAITVSGSATEQIEARAQALVNAGQAETINQAVGIVVAQEPELYRASFSDRIRPEIEKQIESMVENLKPSALDEIQRIADEIYLKGESKTEADAIVFAIQRNPHLYQEHQDAMQEFYDREGMEISVKDNPAPVKIGASDFESKARALVTAGQAKTIDEAFGLVAASDSTAYTAYLASLH